MSAAADTTKHEKGSRAIRESPLREDARGIDSRFGGNDGGCSKVSFASWATMRTVLGTSSPLWIPAPYRGTG